jgi:chromosomal replication initiator protein
MTSESFVQDFVSSLQKGKVEEFKKNCRSLDLLLVDDIHLLAGKEASLVEFFIHLMLYWMNLNKLF